MKLGVEYVFDLNQFNYAPMVADEIRQHRCFKEVALTHDLGDPNCDYVIRGNFNYYKVSTYNDMYYTSIYMFLLPLVVGTPFLHVDGGSLATFEVYRGGTLPGSVGTWSPPLQTGPVSRRGWRRSSAC